MSFTYQEGTVTNSYNSNSIGVVVQAGASVNIDANFQTKSVSMEEFSKWKSEIQRYFTEKQYHELNEKYGSSDCMASFLAGAFGFLFGGNDPTHYLNTRDTFKTDHDFKLDEFVETVYNLKNSNFKVIERLKVTNTNSAPVTATLYFQTTTIEFADGKELFAINMYNPITKIQNE